MSIGCEWEESLAGMVFGGWQSDGLVNSAVKGTRNAYQLQRQRQRQDPLECIATLENRPPPIPKRRVERES